MPKTATAKTRQPQLGFLEEYTLSVLNEAGVKNLSEDLKAVYLPQFVAEAEYRLGVAMSAKLPSAAEDEMVTLLEKEATSAQEWADFWQKHVPEFTDLVAETLKAFAVEVRAALNV